MNTLTWIILISVLGGTLSVATAALFAFSAKSTAVPLFVSYAIGALLGAAFLEILPDAIQAQGDIGMTAGLVLVGILLFFVLEKLVIWRHYHAEGHETCDLSRGHHHDYGRSGTLILIGNTFHNFVDGILIAGAFLQSIPLGIVTAVAIIAHEIPQEVGDFLILLHSGYSRARAFAYNLLSSFSMLAGGVVAYFALSSVQGLVPFVLAFAAASMIYVAVADLIPGLHKRPELGATVQQVSLIIAGIASIKLSHILIHRFIA